LSAMGRWQGAPPAFRIDTPEKLYPRAMANSLSFIRTSRDGGLHLSPLATAPGI